MQLLFKKLGVRERANSNLLNVFQLTSSDWDDYSFKTSFTLTVVFQGERLEIGTLKIGYKSQHHGWTRENMLDTFNELPEGWFSLGQDVAYYQNLKEKFPENIRQELLRALRDVVVDDGLRATIESERVFKDSLTRGVSQSVINGQYKRVLLGEAQLSDFKFSFKQAADERHAAVSLEFDVTAASHPPSNIHVLIGRNGVGKTTLLNNMVGALVAHGLPTKPPCMFIDRGFFETPLKRDYFSSVISISFSAFDPFVPPKDRQDRTEGPAYCYIGMKTVRAGCTNQPTPPKTDADLVAEFVQSFKLCISQPEKKARFYKAVSRLASDSNFEEMEWDNLAEIDDDEAVKKAAVKAGRMSSGHSIVLLTMTKLVEMVEEKTLVLLDEPESHLHPPLLSAFTRALSELLFSRNGVAIVATHSPVVLQEVPKSCVWKMTRSRLEARSDRPNRETFGENVGVLTREVFGLEVSKSGFHEMLESAVDAGGTFDGILAGFDGQLGDEAQAILLSLLREKSLRLAR